LIYLILTLISFYTFYSKITFGPYTDIEKSTLNHVYVYSNYHFSL